jgi:molybdate transport system substrate-binding protein
VRLAAALALVAVVGLGATVAGCATGGTIASTRELTIFAAASLDDALDRIETAYAGVDPGIRLVVSTDSSAALRTQIEQGAPADVFLSADTDNPARLVAAGLTDGGAVTFARTTLALVVPRANPPRLRSFRDLAAPGVRIVAAGSDVPISRYVEELLVRLEREDGAAGIVRGYRRNVVSREDNVRAVLAKVELGEADAGFVYRTDALASDAVLAIPIPPAANVTAQYDAVVLAGGDVEDARRFVDWLAGPHGRAVLKELGFGAAP